MERFSTFDVERILKIRRGRFKEWIDMGYIEPADITVTSVGKKSLFNRQDLYIIKLFDRLLSDGFSREAAGAFVSPLYDIDPEHRKGMIRTDSYKEIVDPLKKNPPELLQIDRIGVDAVIDARYVYNRPIEFDLDNLQSKYLVNFEKIRKIVDEAIEKDKKDR